MTQEEDIKNAIDTLRKGGIILYPTDTIWGIGCDATCAAAVEKVFAIKHRADSKALISLVDSPNRLQRYVRNVPNVAWDMIELSTTPLTVIFQHPTGLAPNLLAEDGSAALRVTHEPFSQELCYRFQKALVSTSANISGEPSPGNFQDISEDIINAVDYVVCARRKEKQKAKPSSIVKINSDGEIQIIRK